MAKFVAISSLLSTCAVAISFPAITPAPDLRKRQAINVPPNLSTVWTPTVVGFSLSYSPYRYSSSGSIISTSGEFYDYCAATASDGGCAPNTLCQSGTLSATTGTYVCPSESRLCGTEYLYASSGALNRLTRAHCMPTDSSTALLWSFYITSPSSPPSSSSTSSGSREITLIAPVFPPDNKTPIGAIVGGVIGGLAALIFAILLVIFILRRRKKQQLLGSDHDHPSGGDAIVTSTGISPMTQHSSKQYYSAPAASSTSTTDPKHTLYASSYRSPAPPQYHQQQPINSAVSSTPPVAASDGFVGSSMSAVSGNSPRPHTSYASANANANANAAAFDPAPAAHHDSTRDNGLSNTTHEMPTQRFASPAAPTAQLNSYQRLE